MSDPCQQTIPRSDFDRDAIAWTVFPKRNQATGEELLGLPNLITRLRFCADQIGDKENLPLFSLAVSLSVAAACKGIRAVDLVTGRTMEAALALRHPAAADPAGPLQRLSGGEQDLSDWLRYRCSLSLMSDLDPKPLVEAAEFLIKGGGLPPKDMPSVQRFREADFPYLEGQSRPLQALKRRIRQVGPTDLGVLVLGETGTGKEAVAFYLHEFSSRRSKPLVTLNCAGLDEALLRSELFGHEKGAFTGAVGRKEGLVELADGGTLFLDELAEMPLPVQADLLRFLQTRRFRRVGSNQEKRVDVRIVAATQPDLPARIQNGLFRSDLYFRIAEVEIGTPALRDIPADVGQVVRHLTYRLAERVGVREEVRRQLAYFESWHDLLAAQQWPGNVRQVAALVKRRVLLGDDVLAELTPQRPSASEAVPQVGLRPTEIRPINEVVRDYVVQVLGNRGTVPQRVIAGRLGCSVNTMKKIARG